MPFSSKSQISMMVHKVDNSLLIDDFDIHKNLLRKQNVSVKIKDVHALLFHIT